MALHCPSGTALTAPGEAMASAAANGDNAGLALILEESRQNFDAGDYADALEVALVRGNCGAIPLLLPHLTPPELGYALGLAAQSGYSAAVSRLLEDPRANPTEAFCHVVMFNRGGWFINTGRPGYHLPSEANLSGITEMLLADPRTDPPAASLKAALEVACRRGRLELVKQVLAHPRAAPQEWHLVCDAHWDWAGEEYLCVRLLLDDGRMPLARIAHSFGLAGYVGRIADEVSDGFKPQFGIEVFDDSARAKHLARTGRQLGYLLQLVEDRRIPLPECDLLEALRLALRREMGELAEAALLRLEGSRYGGRLRLEPAEYRRAEAFFEGYLGRESALVVGACRALLESGRPAWAAAPGEGASAAGEAPEQVCLMALGVVALHSDLAARPLGSLFRRHVAELEREGHAGAPGCEWLEREYADAVVAEDVGADVD